MQFRECGRHDRPDRGPRHPQQLHHRRLGRVHGEPRRHVIERPGVAGAVAGPWDLGHRRPMLRARHPGGVCLEERADLAQVQRPPSPAPLTLVVPIPDKCPINPLPDRWIEG